MTNDESDFEHVTTDAVVESYEASQPVFEALLAEVKLLSKKKPEATMSPGKVKIINRVLEDLLVFLKKEPTGKYLELLDDKTLPQMSDAVLAMVQFDTALEAFKDRYYQRVGDEYTGGAHYYWITTEQIARWETEEDEEESDEDEDEDEDSEGEEEDDEEDEGGHRG